MYDTIIIGGGPAGISTAIYATRYELNTLLITKNIGGTTQEAYTIENYPGFKSIQGPELTLKMQEHLHYLKIETKLENVTKVEKKEENFEVKTESATYQAKSIILATGTQVRKLEIPGEDRLEGKGVVYCATCDAPFYKDKVIAVLGGGNSALTAVIQLNDIARKIYLIYRSTIRGNAAWVKKIRESDKIIEVPQTNVVEVKGKEKLEKIVLDKLFKGKKELEVDGLFIEIGTIPAVTPAKNLGVELDEEEYIKVNEAQETNIPGVYAAGDLTTGSNKLRQIVTAVAEGAIAANSAYENLKQKNGESKILEK
ncbi:hypothetical protein COY23_00545 [bacterium (Candidatus Torokbacteria) CG_4_10_14_0_2_um_filter_35_8]|nr:MAG: hypothetical protein COY23_00545 [bacterium (Candidatus Torokbacteria) CG_4_10_14_0_2_um_filter_35_8]